MPPLVFILLPEVSRNYSTLNYLIHFVLIYIDQSGKIRIWDTTQKTHLLKAEYQPINGAIRDIAWSTDAQRIAVVGEGRER